MHSREAANRLPQDIRLPLATTGRPESEEIAEELLETPWQDELIVNSGWGERDLTCLAYLVKNIIRRHCSTE